MTGGIQLLGDNLGGPGLPLSLRPPGYRFAASGPWLLDLIFVKQPLLVRMPGEVS